MAWTAGPGEIKSIQFDSTTITADLLEGYSLTSEKDSFGAGLGHDVDRGSMLKNLSVTAYDVSAINALHTLMTARTEHDITVTYADDQTQILKNAILRLQPQLNNVTDVCKVWLAASGTANTSIATNWTDLGSTLDVPTSSFSYPFDGNDGCGRPHFSSLGMEVEFMLSSDQWANVTENGEARIAFQLPDGNYQIMDGRTYKNYADDDSSRPRAVRVVLRGVASTWADLIEFADEEAVPTTEAFNAAAPTIIQDRLHGVAIEAAGFGYEEGQVISFP